MSITLYSETRNWERILSHTRDRILPRISQAAFQHDPLTAIFFSRQIFEGAGSVPMKGRGLMTQRGGESVVARSSLGKNLTPKRLTGPWDSYDTTPHRTIAPQRGNWKHYGATSTINMFEKLVNAGDEQISSLLEYETTMTLNSLVDFVTDDLVANGGAADAINDLDDLINANNSVNGLSGPIYAEFNSRGLSARGTAAASISFTGGSFPATGLQNWRTARLNASEGMIHPEAVVTSYTIFQAYEAVLQPQERFTNTKLADAGFEQLAYYTAPVMPSPRVATGTTYFLRFSEIEVIALEGATFTALPFQQEQAGEGLTSLYMFKGQTMVHNRHLVNKVTGQTA